MQNKITFLVSTISNGGAEAVCVNIANGLAERGWQVDLLVLHTKNKSYIDRLSQKVNLVDLKPGVLVMRLLLCFKEIFNKKISRTDKAQLFSVIALCLVASLFSMVYPAYGSASLAIGLLGYLIGKSHAAKKIN